MKENGYIIVQLGEGVANDRVSMSVLQYFAMKCLYMKMVIDKT